MFLPLLCKSNCKVSANRAKNKIKTKIFVFSSEVQPNFFAEKVSDELLSEAKKAEDNAK